MAISRLALRNQMGQQVAESAATILQRCEQAGLLLHDMCEQIAWLQAGHVSDDAAAQDTAEHVHAAVSRMASLLSEATHAAGRMMVAAKAREAAAQ